jgi:hypothetical protein
MSTRIFGKEDFLSHVAYKQRDQEWVMVQATGPVTNSSTEDLPPKVSRTSSHITISWVPSIQYD